MRRRFALVAMLAIAGALLWTIATCSKRQGGQRGDPPPDRVSTARPAAAEPIPPPLPVKSWQTVEGLPGRIAVFDTVFWEPEDTASIRAAIRDSSLLEGKRVLDIGTGTGLLALACVAAGAAGAVATDINPAAVANAVYNARLLGLADRIEVRLVPPDRPGAYAVIGDSETFDLIVSNPPWQNNRPKSIDKFAYYDPDFELLRSLLEGLEDHLNPHGQALLACGSVDAIETIKRLAAERGLDARIRDPRSLQALPEVFLPGMMIEVAPRREP